MSSSEMNEPFGIPDGAIGSIDEFDDRFVHMPDHYGGISRALDDAGVRVVVGRLGAGKSLYLRMMRNAQFKNGSVYTEELTGNLSDLSTEDVVKFATQTEGGADTEPWKLLWRRAIFRSAASYILKEHLVSSTVPGELIDELQTYQSLLGDPQRKRRVTTEASQIINSHSGRAALRSYLKAGGWPDAEAAVLEAISSSRPLFLYVDAIDDNFRWAPTYWMRCQRGLFDAVMDLVRQSAGGSRLHVVIALRDIVLGSKRDHDEHALRRFEQVHLNVLGWNRQSITEFLHHKVERLPDSCFEDPEQKTVASWLSMSSIYNSRPQASIEPIASYLVRHTRTVPRDIVVLGNRLSRYVFSQRSRGEEISEKGLREEVSHASREFASGQLAQCANQIISDGMPTAAVKHDFANVYLRPNEFQMADAVENICSAIRTVGTEEFGLDGVSTLDDMSTDSFGFGTKVHLASILWQNGLVAWLGDGVAHYYSLDDIASTALPRSVRYAFNPILFDRIAELRPSPVGPLPTADQGVSADDK